MPAMGIYKIPTGIKGPIPKGSVGLLLRHSSLTSKGVQDLMGIIGEGYEGEISIMMKTEYPYQIIKGDCIAQLLLLPMSLLVNLILKEPEDLEVQENGYIGKLLYLILDLHYLYILIISNFQDL